MFFFDLVKAECIMLKGEIKQYYMNYIFYNIGLIVMFIGLFYSLEYDSNSKEGAVLLIGLVLWQLCTSALSYLPFVVSDEATMGTLEQIFMTRTNIKIVLLSKALVSFSFNLFKALLLFIICTFIFGNTNVFLSMGYKNIYILLIIIITTTSFYMLGLLVAGLALFFKRVGSVVNILNYIILFFSNITIPASSLPIAFKGISYFISVSWAMEIIRAIVYENIHNTSYYVLIGFISSTICFTFIGLIGFKMSLDKAKNLGKLGHY